MEPFHPGTRVPLWALRGAFPCPAAISVHLHFALAGSLSFLSCPSPFLLPQLVLAGRSHAFSAAGGSVAGQWPSEYPRAPLLCPHPPHPLSRSHLVRSPERQASHVVSTGVSPGTALNTSVHSIASSPALSLSVFHSTRKQKTLMLGKATGLLRVTDLMWLVVSLRLCAGPGAPSPTL